MKRQRQNLLRELPHEIAVAAKAEAARRRMSIKNWLIETIRFRLDLLDFPLPPKKRKVARVVKENSKEHTVASAPTLPQELPICGKACESDNCVTGDDGRNVHEESYSVQIGRAS